MKVNIDFNSIPKQKYFFDGKEYVGEVAFVNGFNSYSKTENDGVMCALISNSAFTKGKANQLTDADGNIYHSENRRGQIDILTKL